MEANAQVSFVRIAPRKMSIICDEIRGKNINEALTYLRWSPRKRTAGILSTLLKSAAANAQQKGTMDLDQLVVKTLIVNGGPTLKRFMQRAKGSASGILKRTSHVKVTLAEKA
jgi:large subunit ribosomal protein L22